MPKSFAYRPELDGVRAVAVLLVIRWLAERRARRHVVTSVPIPGHE